MREFRAKGGVYVAGLAAGERRVLLDVVDGVIDLLDDGTEVPDDDLDPFARLSLAEREVETPEDPALHRLLPDASDDPDLAAELRRLTEADLRLGKLEHLRTWRAAIDGADPDLVVAPDDASAVAAAMTDARLVLASRLGLVTDEQADEVYTLAASRTPPADDQDATRRFLASVYAVLTALQESLVGLMSGELDRRDDPHTTRR